MPPKAKTAAPIRRTSKRIAQRSSPNVNYLNSDQDSGNDSSDEENDFDNVSEQLPRKRQKRTRSSSNQSLDDDEKDDYNDDFAGGFIKPTPKPRRARASAVKASGPATKPKSKGKETSKSIKRQTRSSVPNSMQSPALGSDATTANTSPEVLEDTDILSIPMSSKQANLLAKSLANKRKTRKLHISDDSNNEISDNDSDSDFKGSSDKNSDSDYEDDDIKIVEAKKATVNKTNSPANNNLQDPVEIKSSTDDESVKDAKPKPTRKKASKTTHKKRDVRETWNASLFMNHPYLETIFEEMEKETVIQPLAIPQPEGMTIELLPFQKEGLHWLIEQEHTRYKGGILADEMGMGKTIQTIALFMSDKQEERQTPNLVLAPAVALLQWQNEIEAHSGGKLTSLVFHGKGAKASYDEILKYDVVLTTYSLLESVFRKQEYGFKRKNGVVKEKSIVHKIEWHRIVLDEAHSVKQRHSSTSRAVSHLLAERRLCLSGTPLQNRVGELYSLIKFLQVTPFCQYFCRKCPCAKTTWDFTGKYCNSCNHFYGVHHNFFNFSLLHDIQRPMSDNHKKAMDKLRLLLKKIMLRRTKTERADDLGLPPRVVEIRRDYFNPEEKDLYQSIYSDSTRKFNTYVAQGVVLNNYANIFSLITRMRQIADHPDLVLKRHMAGAGLVQNTIICKLCDDPAEEPIQSKCHHDFCRLCITEYCESWSGDPAELECPVCHVGLSIDLLGPAISEPTTIDMQSGSNKKSIINRINMSGGWRSSTKIEALVEELYKLRSNKQTIKSIVFSQFTSMLDLVEWRLNKAGFQTVKLQGSMSPTQRDAIIKHFMTTPSVEVFLVSLKAGGVALNLCEASQVFILDPWWNPSVEWQSGDRVHRIGQHRPVKITRLIIQDSIESRIVELQEKKASMINATIDYDDAAMQRLTTADVQFLFQI